MPKPTKESKALIEYVRKNGKDRSWAELTKMFNPNKSSDWARCTLRANGFNVNSNQFDVENKIEYSKHRQENARFREESSHLLRKIIDLQNDLRILSKIKDYSPERFNIQMPQAKRKNEATAIVQWSDWHVDEVVKLESTNGLNEYNKQIAKKRSIVLAQNTVKIIESQRQAADIDNLVLHLGGDAIGGYIHPELQQTNSMSPLEGILYAKELLISAIHYLLNNGGLKNIIVVTSRGNHPRLTPKMQFSNDYSMNLETFLYISLADHFKDNSKIAFKIEESELSYLNIYDKVFRFFHGHQIRFQGGIGGLTIPLYKAIHRWNANIKAYYNFMCDKHTYSTPTPDCQANGSLKGYDAYAVSHGFSYQPPLQSFTLMDSKRGITIKAPIFCE